MGFQIEHFLSLLRALGQIFDLFDIGIELRACLIDDFSLVFLLYTIDKLY